MTVDERSRHALYRKLEEILGREDATTLMEHLPPVGWAGVATKRDLDHLAVATKRDLDHLAVATKRDLDHLAVATKRDLDHLAEANQRDHSHLQADLVQLEIRMTGRMETMEHRVLATFRKELTSQTRTFALAMTGSFLTAAGIAVAAAVAL
ncbi:MAG: hypothetical protein ACRDH8_03645 [Actinomycetota bacterium]